MVGPEKMGLNIGVRKAGAQKFRFFLPSKIQFFTFWERYCGIGGGV